MLAASFEHEHELELAPSELDRGELEPTELEPCGRQAATGDPLQLVLREARRYPLLSPVEELELARRIERGDAAARERMILSNLRLVVSIARRYQTDGITLCDLVHEGVIGLIHAIEKFDRRKGFRFSTYASWWIRQSVQRGVANKARMIRIPLHVVERGQTISRSERELAAALGRAPSEEEVARHARLSLVHLREVHAAARTVASTEAVVGEDGETRLGDLAAAGGPSTEELVDLTLRRAAVRRAVARLPERQREVISLRFGLVSDEPRTLEQVGRQLGITPQRAGQIEAEALRRLAGNRAIADAA
jgi:RNA polymerase primary sigma factor